METKEEKVIYARVVDTEFIDYNYWWDVYTEDLSGIFILVGNRNYRGHNDGIIDNIEALVDDFDLYFHDTKQFSSISDYIYYFLNPKTYAHNGKRFSTITIHKIKEALDKGLDSKDKIEKILSAIYNKEIERTYLRGFSQGESIECYYEKDTITKDYLKLLQDIFFGGIKEVRIYDNEDFEDCVNEFITNSYDIVEAIKTEYQLTEDSKTKIVLEEFDGYIKTPKYKRSEY